MPAFPLWGDAGSLQPGKRTSMERGRKLRRVALVAAVAASSACVVAAWVPSTAAAETLRPLNTRETALLHAMNRVRARHGLRRLRLNDSLVRAATRHANSMGGYGYARHELYTPWRSADWTLLPTWLRWYWPGPGFSSYYMGENIAWGAPDLSTRRAMYFWMHSPPHRANILGGFRRVGIAAVTVHNPAGEFGAYDDVTFWAVDFGRRSR
jgi:uncharacterized protein YkwD